MAKDHTRLDTSRTTNSGPQERILGDHPIEAIEAGILTPEGSLALDGGHLPGNKDQLHAGTKTHGPASPVPGATGNNGNSSDSESDDLGFTPQDPQPKSGGTVPNFRTAEPNEAAADFGA